MAEERKGKGPAGKQDDQKKGGVFFSQAVPASVEEVTGRTGSRGEAIQVRSSDVGMRTRS